MAGYFFLILGDKKIRTRKRIATEVTTTKIRVLASV
jgi:hypothetical protein